ncbi:MAG: DUF1972 domain-containing protein [Actinomycetota bacterium]|nr:DUF1972 domain-containing protein [Actinomycetota bacterium]
MSAAGGADHPSALDIGVFGARAIPSTYSGYETFLTTLLPELSARGHNVTMYCRTTELEGDGPYRGVQRVMLPAIAGKHFNTLSHGLLASARARLAGHDVLLVVNVANSLFCAMNKYTGQPVFLNTDGQEWLRGKWGPVARRFFRFSADVAQWSTTGLIADCAAMAKVYSDQFHAESTVIPYCSPPTLSRFDTGAPNRLDVRRGGYFLIAGRLNPENNIDRMAEEYARSEFAEPLLVLGTANYRSPVERRLQRLAAADERIRLVGHVGDRSEFLDLLGSAAAYLHGHSVGGMNPSLVEAMAAGALVVALDTPFSRETLGGTGLFFSMAPSNSLSLGSVLADLHRMSEAQQQMLRTGAVERVQHVYAHEAVVEAYEQLLASSLSSGSREPVSIETRWSAQPADTDF